MEVNKINIVYFSPTHTSAKIAKAVANGFAGVGNEVFDATKKDITLDAAERSLTIVAVPVYGGHIAITARHRIEMLKGNGTPAIPIVVYGNRAYEEALKELSALLEEKGFVTVAGATFIGEHSYSTDAKPIAKGRPDARDLQFAEDFGRAVSLKMGKLSEPERGRVDVAKIRKPRQSFFKLLGFIFSVLRLRRSGKPMPVTPVTDESLCRHCAACAAACPVAAIEKGREETTNASRCIRCCACVKLCPHKARVFDTPFADLLTKYFGRQKENCTIL